ncbi:LuxR C-terminal-related transcriptional regulator [Sphingosinicella microcystinivorans]|uniref:LuxR C-terminal-related transcriptional regulator n=1 Tax=Sphingosinicella microcystinivorans TaxID=335406 RepID=UPI0022F39045|nr:LuxR C-terminal-related transcriptional regulator [Sphingosinicella microcystinivorans]WBX84235.1 LuxR C-terminal-related transcriptional regulator [Sphingosinicella microcystinivorans]
MLDVIAAKFDPPIWMGEQLHRGLLLRQLDCALSHRLTLVHAPAGYGKTSLLAQWRGSLAPAAAQVAWLTLERDDRDLKRLVRYLLIAIHSDAREGSRKTSSSDLPPRAALSAIINGLAGRSKPFVLILDDLHHADSEPVVTFLQWLIRLAPANCHFVFASRDYPRLGQSVLAAEGQVLEITAHQLKFSLEEAESLLARTDERLAASDIETILDRTEGWPIAVQLASLSLKRGGDAGRAIDAYCGSSTDLARYLSEQVLMTLPQETREIVIRTALLDRLTGGMVDLLCDRQDGWLVLERLEQQGVFLAPVTWERREYRYHQLFAEYLRDRFERSDRAGYSALQRRIAQWFAERGMVADAVNHAMLASDDALLAGIIEDAGGWRLIPQGLQGVVERGLSKLPRTLIRSRPGLALAQVYLQIKLGELGAARAEYDRLAAEAERAELSAGIRIEMQVVGETLADYENQPMTFEDLLAREALLRKLPANDHLVLANISETLGAKYFEGGWLERALQPTLAAREHYQACGSLYSDLFTRFLEARIKRAQGRSKEAAAILEAAWQAIVENFGARSDLAANCAAFQAELLYEQDRVAEARELLSWALPHMEQSDGWVDVYAVAYFTEAGALAGEGAFGEACDVVARARRVAGRRRLVQLEQLADIGEVDLRMTEGVSPAVVRAAADATGLDRYADMMAEESPQYRPVAVAASLCRVRLGLFTGAYEAALEELARLRAWADQRGAGRLLVDVNILAAAGMRGLGAIEDARHCFDEAVSIAMFQDIVRPFVDARLFVQPCLDDAMRADPQVDRFRAQFLKSLARTLATCRSVATGQGPFTEAEAEVLLYLSQGHSNKEIARLIGMSPDTVKYRLKSVFRKIGASRRRDAVRIAAERGLVSGQAAPYVSPPRRSSEAPDAADFHL